MKQTYLNILIFIFIAAITLAIFAITKLTDLPFTIKLRPSPSPVRNVQEEARAKFLAELPITTAGFDIGYSPKYSKVVAVEIFAKDKDEFFKRKAEAASFIKKFGIDDFCSLEVRFIPIDEAVRQVIKNADMFSEGCQLPDWVSR